jgi:hypothetical protein
VIAATTAGGAPAGSARSSPRLGAIGASPVLLGNAAGCSAGCCMRTSRSAAPSTSSSSTPSWTAAAQRQARFAAGNVLDALAPTSLPWSNPPVHNRRRGHRWLRLSGPQPDRLRAPAHRAQPRRRQPRHVPRCPGRPGDAVDRHARLREAEAALAATDGPPRPPRRVRPHQARPRLGLGRAGDHRAARRRHARGTASCSTTTSSAT